MLSAVHLLPLVASAVVAWSLSQLGQFHELYLSYIEDVTEALTTGKYLDALPTAFAGLLMVLLCLAIFIANRELGQYKYQSHAGEVIEYDLVWKVRLVGIVAALLPLAGLVNGLSEAINLTLTRIAHVEGAALQFHGGLNFTSIRLVQEVQQYKSMLQSVQNRLGNDPLSSLVVWTLAVLAASAFVLVVWRWFSKRLLAFGLKEHRWRISRGMATVARWTYDASCSAGLIWIPWTSRILRRPCVAIIVLLTIGNLFVPLVLTLMSAEGSGQSASASWFPDVFWFLPKWSEFHAAVCKWSILICTPSAVGTWAATLAATVVFLVAVWLAPQTIPPLKRHLVRHHRVRFAHLVLMVTLAVAGGKLLISGFMEFPWVSIARGFGPLAMVIAVILVIFALLTAMCIASRDMRLPALLSIGWVTVMIVLIKLEKMYWLIFLMMMIQAAAIISLRRTGLARASNIAGVALLITIFCMRITFQSASNIDASKSDPFVAASLPHVVASFDAWYKARQAALEAFTKLSNHPYPAFIIAAEGGGIYAAATTSTFLARMQDRCASFAQHIFAVSGVSGGSVGAAVFHAAAADDLTGMHPEGCDRPSRPAGAPGSSSRMTLQDRVAATVRDDHLSPIVGLIVPDLLGLHEDRAIGLELSLMSSLDRHRPTPTSAAAAVASAGALAKPLRFGDHWHANMPAPALVLNTTWVRRGDRVAFSPFDLSSPETVTLSAFGKLGDTYQWGSVAKTSMVKAAVASARFPGMVPAFVVRNSKNEGALFVDGGYVDASGAMTAYEIVRILRTELSYRQAVAECRKVKQQLLESPSQSGQHVEQLQERSLERCSSQVVDKAASDPQDPTKPVWNIDLRLLLLTSSKSDDGARGATGAGLKDFAAPIEALMNVRSLLSRNAVRETIAKLAPDSVDAIERLDHPSQRGHAYLPPPKDAARAAQPQPWPVTVIELNQEDFRLPLGWKISGVTHDVVALQLGQPSLCDAVKTDASANKPLVPLGPLAPPANERSSVDEVAKTIRANSCVMASIERLLTGGRLAN